MLYDLPPLADLSRKLASGEETARALAERALAAQSHGAYRTVDADRTLAWASAADAALRLGVVHGPLHGVPVSVKDLYGVPGWPTYGGSKRALPARFTEAGPIVAGLLEQLAVVIGKTHTVEFAFGGIGTNPVGTPRNPWSPGVHRVPGGSSAGAGVSLQEGSALLALGTDTAGSVRIPAAWTGVVGLKTTAGRWSTEGIVPLSPTLDTAGILTRTVADAITAFLALDPWASPVPRGLDLGAIRVARAPDLLWEGASPGVVEAVEAALADAPARAVKAALPGVEEAMELFSRGGPVAAELDSFLATELPDARETLDPNVAARVAKAGELPAREYLRRRQRLRALAAGAAAAFEHADVFVSPTVANSPPTVAEIADPEAYRAQNVLSLRNTGIGSYLGVCGISIPCGRDAQGMPVGLQLLAAPGEEERLLGIAAAYEARLGPAAERLGRPPRPAEGRG